MTSTDDPRITAAVNKAAQVAYSMVGSSGQAWADRNVWAVVHPAAVGNNWAWCGGYMDLCFRRAGVNLMRCAWWYYTPYIKTFAQRIGAWKTDGGSYGDNVLFDWDPDGVIDHVGMSIPDYDSAYYRSVEGNTSPGNSGSQSNGGGVWERYRDWADIAGWVDMRVVLAWMLDNGLWDGTTTEGDYSDEENELNSTEKAQLAAVSYLLHNNHGQALAAVDRRTAEMVSLMRDLKKSIDALAAKIK